MQSRVTSTEERAVLAANDAFYRAFRERDLPTMRNLWSKEHPIACVHPGWEALRGRDEVLASWQAILENPDAPRVECVQAVASLLGDSAYVICTESLGHVELVATNYFVRERGDWKLVHHQAAPFARDPDGDGIDHSHLN